MSTPINDEVALRVGLAAKELPSVEVRELLQLLISIMGEPITPARLDKLRARALRNTGGELFAAADDAQFEKAFALLKGRGVQKLLSPTPEFAPGVFCEIRGSLRVACASDSGEVIDGQFSNCMRFLIYQVSPDYIRLIDIREPSAVREPKEKNQFRASLLQDCALLYTTSIGTPAAAKAVKVGLHPIRLSQPQPAQEELRRLQPVLSQENPPPWLAKAMGKPTLGVKLYGENIS